MSKLFGIVALCLLLSACDTKIVAYDRCEEYLDSSDVVEQIHGVGSIVDLSNEELCESDVLIRYDHLSESHMLFEHCHDVCSNELLDLFSYIEGTERIRAAYCDSVGRPEEDQFLKMARDRLEELSDRVVGARGCLSDYMNSEMDTEGRDS